MIIAVIDDTLSGKRRIRKRRQTADVVSRRRDRQRLGRDDELRGRRIAGKFVIVVPGKCRRDIVGTGVYSRVVGCRRGRDGRCARGKRSLRITGRRLGDADGRRVSVPVINTADGKRLAVSRIVVSGAAAAVIREGQGDQRLADGPTQREVLGQAGARFKVVVHDLDLGHVIGVALRSIGFFFTVPVVGFVDRDRAGIRKFNGGKQACRDHVICVEVTQGRGGLDVVVGFRIVQAEVIAVGKPVDGGNDVFGDVEGCGLGGAELVVAKRVAARDRRGKSVAAHVLCLVGAAVRRHIGRGRDSHRKTVPGVRIAVRRAAARRRGAGKARQRDDPEPTVVGSGKVGRVVCGKGRVACGVGAGPNHVDLFLLHADGKGLCRAVAARRAPIVVVRYVQSKGACAVVGDIGAARFSVLGIVGSAGEAVRRSAISDFPCTTRADGAVADARNGDRRHRNVRAIDRKVLRGARSARKRIVARLCARKRACSSGIIARVGLGARDRHVDGIVVDFVADRASRRVRIAVVGIGTHVGPTERDHALVDGKSARNEGDGVVVGGKSAGRDAVRAHVAVLRITVAVSKRAAEVSAAFARSEAAIADATVCRRGAVGDGLGFCGDGKSALGDREGVSLVFGIVARGAPIVVARDRKGHGH